MQAYRNDLNNNENLLVSGINPNDIMATNFRCRHYEKMKKTAYLNKRIQETSLIKDMKNEYHMGESGTGKTIPIYIM